MELRLKISSLVKLAQSFIMDNPLVKEAIRKSSESNSWFTPVNCKLAIENISNSFLSKGNLESWLADYDIPGDKHMKIGLILAGNIPLVGFHDILCTYLSGNISVIKLSDKDSFLIPLVVNMLSEINPENVKFFEFTEKIENPDAIIATGSNTSALYFEKYFSKYPHIIRKNRNAISILKGDETKEEIRALGRDVFSYFGLGCRNVSKIFVPEGYDLTFIMEVLHDFNDIILHSKYQNNYNFNYATYLLNKEDFLMNGALILRKHKDLVSRIACLNYEYYSSLEDLEGKLEERKDLIQCITTKIPLKNNITIPLGNAQSPGLKDYADGVDTMQFLINLS